MNILYSVFAEGWGGLEKYPLTLYESLKKRGNNIYILTKKESKLYNESQKLKIECIGIDGFKKLSLKTIKEMRRVIKEKKIDVVHINTSRELYNWRIALLGNEKVKVVMTFHIGVPNHNEVLHKFLYKRVNSIIAISRFEMEEMYEKIPVTKEKINLLYNGVNLDKFKNSDEKYSNIRERFSIPKDAILFLSIGNLSLGKGVIEWIETTKKICKEQSKNLYFLWVGDDSHITENYTMADLKKNISDAGLEKRIILAGYQTDILSFLKSSDIFLLPARRESFGIVYIEAMTMGLPVIGCNAAGAKEIITDGVQGYLCEPNNPESMEEVILKSVKNIEKLREIGKKNIEYVKKFSMENHIENLLSIYTKE